MEIKLVNSKIVISFAVLIQSLIWIFVLLNHNTFEEWDGVIHYFSGDFFWKEGVYTGWGSHFWPPLQPLLISLGDPLIIGKFIAFLSGVVTLYCCYKISCLLGSKHSMLISAAVFSFPFFVVNFSSVENHAMETAFYMLSILSFHMFIIKGRKRTLIASAVFVALAGLTRYTSYSLALTIGLYLLFFMKKNKYSNFTLYSITFIAISSLWWLPNFIMNGSPLATWQYFNMGMRVYPGSSEEWWWVALNHYNSTIDIISAYPIEYIYNFLSNICSTGLIIGSTITFGVGRLGNAIGLLFLLFYTFRSGLYKKFIYEPIFVLIIIASTIYGLLCSNAFVFVEALLPVLISLSLIFFNFALNNRKSSTPYNFIIVFMALNLIVSAYRAHAYVDDQRTKNQLHSYKEVVDVISRDATSEDILISSIHPANGYYQNSDWIIAPLGGVSDFCDVINYNFSNKIFEYAAKSNFLLEKDTLKIDYIILTKDLARRWKFINEDLTLNKSDSCYNNATSIFKNDGVNVLKINY